MLRLIMAIFKKKKEKYVDLSEKMRKQKAQAESFKNVEPEVEKTNVGNTDSNSNGGFFGGFFGGSSPSTEHSEPTISDSDEKRRRLAKRIGEMSSRIEENEKEIYQLKQRLEILEKKQRLGY